MTVELSEQEKERRESLEELRQIGINPYPAQTFKTNNNSKKIKTNYTEGQHLEVVVAGRIMSRRIMGKASFVELQDSRML